MIAPNIEYFIPPNRNEPTAVAITVTHAWDLHLAKKYYQLLKYWSHRQAVEYRLIVNWTNVIAIAVREKLYLNYFHFPIPIDEFHQSMHNISNIGQKVKIRVP